MIDLENESIVLEIRELVNGIDKIKGEIDIYGELVKQLFLNGSGRN